MAPAKPIEIRRREPVTDSGTDPLTTEGLKLFPQAPNPENVRQKRIENCPLAAILAAIANACPAQIVKMVKERPSVVKSWFDGEQEKQRFLTNKIITVFFRDHFVDISPVLYLDFFKQPRFAASSDGGCWVS